MASSEKSNGSVQGREKALRSKKLYWVVGTVVIALVLFTLYYSLYVSAQQAYYNERAFRLLSSMGDKFAADVEIAGNVLMASSTYPDPAAAGDYIQHVLHGKMEEQDFAITGFHKKDPNAIPTRAGTLTLYLPDAPNTFRLRADYREVVPTQGPKAGNQKKEKPVQGTLPENPCTGDLPDLLVCATIDFAPMVSRAFRDLQEGFFDDILIADSQGPVLYQQSPGGIRIQNLSDLPPPPAGFTSGSFFSKAASPSPSPDAGATTSHSSFYRFSQFSSERDVDLAGSTYKLYVQPLSVSLRQKQQDRRLVLCGLRTLKHSQGQVLVVPYTYLIWSVLVVLTAFALGWPLLKFIYISSKERLHSRHILYLISSILLATAFVTLIALNASYKLTSDESSENELKQLAGKINSNMNAELDNALATLDILSSDESLLKLAAGNDWNQPKFLERYKTLSPKSKPLPYPYFRYFFLADDDGWQRLKFTVNPEPTPKTNVKDELYFHLVKDGQLSKFRAGKVSYDFRMDPLYSPNTGEFLVVLASPLPDKASLNLPAPKLRVSVLAIKLESLYKPVLPSGFGYAVVDLQGKVLFHSTSVRNLNEDFNKEAREDASVVALIAEGSTGSLDVNYLGTDKKLWITPIDGLSDPRLTLIVYKDSSYFTTANTVIVIVFSVLVVVYAILPFFFAVFVHLIRQGDYPLEAIWPCDGLKGCYLDVLLANVVLSQVFFFRYVAFGLTQALISVFAVALAGAVYPFLVCHSRSRSRLIGNIMVLTVLVVVSGLSWVLVFPAAFATYAFYRRSLLLEKLFIDWVPLKYAYTLVAASILVTLVVVPSCGFFRVSYDYVQRLVLETQQLELAQRLKDRQLAIRDYYSHLNTPPSFRDARLNETLDRYDSLFLNCPPQNPDPSQARELHPSFAEATMLGLTAQFPTNALAAKLRELAQTKKRLPGLLWKASPRVDACAASVRSHRSLWLINSGDPIVSPWPTWPALDPRVRLILTAAIMALAVWVHFVPSRLFLVDMENLPPLDKWHPEENENVKHLPHHILLLGHPKSGKRLTVRQVQPVQIADFAEMVITGTWSIPEPSPEVIALNHFEFAIDNADANTSKLHLLEELAYVRRKRIILLSTVDPLYYLAAGSPDIVVAGKEKDLPTAIQLLDRWAALLTGFRKLTIEDITVAGFHRVVAKIGNDSKPQPFREFVRRVVQECDHTAQLRKIGATILRTQHKKAGLSREKLIQELLDRADSYYRVLWSTCTQDERLVLYQLAQDGWANPKNELAIQHLQRRRLVTLAPGLRIMNESFRQFVRSSQYHEEIVSWEREGEQSVWRYLKLSLGILAVAAAAWLLYSQQQFFNAVLGYIGAIGAATGVVFKLLSDLRGKPSSANASAAR
jgi:hypothetical protein